MKMKKVLKNVSFMILLLNMCIIFRQETGGVATFIRTQNLRPFVTKQIS